MKISEFAELNNVTAKMLRYYDEIGLLKPAVIDPATGYRSYNTEQSNYLNWIIILKNLDFSLARIKEILSGPVDGQKMILELTRKRIEISSAMNEQTEKKITIDKLIILLEKEGFHMDKQISLLSMEQKSIHDIKKNFPNMEMFLETACDIAALCEEDDSLAVFRFDISHFKQVNDDYGFEIGDKVIVACYNIIDANIGKHLSQPALGRAHGDEFIVFAKAGREEAEKAAQAIIKGMQQFHFSSVGCGKQMGCYIGGLIFSRKTYADIRNMMELSIEFINQARKKGVNSVVIESYESA